MEEIERLRKLPREEQRRREEAKERASASQPSTLYQYLETCHSLSLAIKVVTDHDTRGYDAPDRPDLSPTNHPVECIRRKTKRSLETALLQSLLFFPGRLSIPAPA